MKTFLILVLAVLTALPACGLAQEKQAPPVVDKGFAALQKAGVLAAIDAWLTGSARETDDGFQDQVAVRMNRVQGFFGRPAGFETIRVVNFSASTQRVYVAAKFEKGVAWMSFDCFKPKQEWIITRLDFQTSANLVLPPNILGGQ